jgi:hypothetical protein
MRQTAFLIVAILAASQLAMPQAEDLNVFTRWVEWADAPVRLRLHLNSIAIDLLERVGRQSHSSIPRLTGNAGAHRSVRHCCAFLGPFRSERICGRA